MAKRWQIWTLAAVLAAGVSACGPAEEDDGSTDGTDEEADDMDQFAATGKTDTGYVSDQAAELNSEFSGTIVIDAAKRGADKDTLLAKARASDKAFFAQMATDQVKFARNVLKTQKFNANIESGNATVSSVTLAGTVITVKYTQIVESLVKNKDLPAGTTVSSLIGSSVALKLPADPKLAFTTGGFACATDPDEPNNPAANTEAVLGPEMNENNYFFYWNPEKSTCRVATQAATFAVKSTGGSGATYPEFDQLLADKVISEVIVFGQLEHGELIHDDWGWVGYEEMIDWLKAEGYKEKLRVPAGATLYNQKNSSWSKTYTTGMTVNLDLISPLDLQDHADSAIKDGIIKNAIKTHEIVYYNGHSFYGSLSVLNDPANFPSTYQLIFMDSCWSYAYYTKQVFTSKTTAADPTGMLKADVLNNTEPGISGSHATFQIFMKKFFVAAKYVAMGQKSKAKSYTWKNLVTYMNTSAKKRAEESTRAGDPTDPEVYGVSGVATNKWKP